MIKTSSTDKVNPGLWSRIGKESNLDENVDLEYEQSVWMYLEFCVKWGVSQQRRGYQYRPVLGSGSEYFHIILDTVLLKQGVANIFAYSNIQIFWSLIFIWIFFRINFSYTNIFKHSFVSNLFVRIYSDIRS